MVWFSCTLTADLHPAYGLALRSKSWGIELPASESCGTRASGGGRLPSLVRPSTAHSAGYTLTPSQREGDSARATCVRGAGGGGVSRSYRRGATEVLALRD